MTWEGILVQNRLKKHVIRKLCFVVVVTVINASGPITVFIRCTYFQKHLYRSHSRHVNNFNHVNQRSSKVKAVRQWFFVQQFWSNFQMPLVELAFNITASSFFVTATQDKNITFEEKPSTISFLKFYSNKVRRITSIFF